MARTGAVPLRRELRALQRNFPDQYNLLILGLKNLEGQSETGLTSYYQLAGVRQSNSSCLYPLSAISGAVGSIMLPNYSRCTPVRRIIADIVG